MGRSVDYDVVDADNDVMAILNIRNLPDDVHAALRLKAAKSGLSMEAEACREKKQPAAAEKLQQLVQELYRKHKPVDTADELIQQRQSEQLRLCFSNC